MDYGSTQEAAPYATAIKFTKVKRSYKNDNRTGRKDKRRLVREFKKHASFMLDMADIGTKTLDRAAGVYRGAGNPLGFEGLCSVFNHLLIGEAYDVGTKYPKDEFFATPGYQLMRKFLTREEYISGLGEHNEMNPIRAGVLRSITRTHIDDIMADLKRSASSFGSLVLL